MASMSDMNKAAKQVKGWFGQGSVHRKFGTVGPPKQEQACEHVNAYLTCYGYLSTEQKKVELSPFDTLEDAQVKFGRHMRQQCILDEEGYHLEENKSAPLWKYTTRCNVSLLFTYSKNQELQTVANQTQQAGTESLKASVKMVELVRKMAGSSVQAVTNAVKSERRIETSEVLDKVTRDNDQK